MPTVIKYGFLFVMKYNLLSKAHNTTINIIVKSNNILILIMHEIKQPIFYTYNILKI